MLICWKFIITWDFLFLYTTNINVTAEQIDISETNSIYLTSLNLSRILLIIAWFFDNSLKINLLRLIKFNLFLKEINIESLSSNFSSLDLNSDIYLVNTVYIFFLKISSQVKKISIFFIFVEEFISEMMKNRKIFFLIFLFLKFIRFMLIFN